jgi:hypothetical protein
MEDMGPGISPKETDAICRVINSRRQISGVELFWDKGLFLEVVVLTVKAVKGTGMIKDSQVLVSVFRASCIGIARIPTARARGAHKGGYAIGWKGIVIKGESSFVGPASLQLTVSDVAEPTKPCAAFWDLASANTKRAAYTLWIAGRLHRKAVGRAASGMSLGNLRPDLREMAPDAVGTEADNI